MYLGEEHSLRRDSKGKDPEAGPCLACLGNNKEVSVADVDRVRGRVTGVGDSMVEGARSP